MSKADFVRRLMALLTTLVVVGASVLPRASHGETAGIDPWAEQLLKAATDCLASQQRFGVETRSTIEVVLCRPSDAA